MRTNIVIDDDLIARAMQASGLSTKHAAVEAGLRLLVKVYEQGDIRQLRGKVKWQGSLEEMRASRVAESQTPYDEEITGS